MLAAILVFNQVGKAFDVLTAQQRSWAGIKIPRNAHGERGGGRSGGGVRWEGEGWDLSLNCTRIV